MSNTIVLYENGKAVGGEGHPTNANEISFNNEDTNLVSEEVESAIKEVDAKIDRGSVSVTADGIETYSALFNRLGALVDVSKIGIKSCIQIGVDSGIINHIGSNAILFHSFEFHSARLIAYRHAVALNGGTISSTLQYTIDTTPSLVVTDNSTVVPLKGTRVAIYY